MSCSIVVIIDQSDSMRQYGYLADAKACASMFVAEMDEGDSLGVVSYSDIATILFGTQTSLIRIKSRKDLEAAMDQIDTIESMTTTNMVEAFKTAGKMIAGATGAAGEVFLSDGEYNDGGNPVPKLAEKPPVHTIALGKHGQEATLVAIKEKTHGSYHMTPDPRELAEIYNAISGQIPVAALVTNVLRTAEQYESVETSATVPAGATLATFSFFCGARDVVYTTDKYPKGNQVTVTLYDPAGNKLDNVPAVTGKGFVVLKIANPKAGTYTAITVCGRKGSLLWTAAAFDNKLSIKAAITGPREVVAAGSPATVDFQLADGDDPIDGARIEATLDSPLVTLAEAAAANEERLKAVSVSGDTPEEHRTSAKIAALQRETGENLLPRELRPVIAQAMGGGLYRFQIPNVEKAGSHTVRVVAHGYSAKSATAFQRSTRISFLVSDKP